MATRWISSRCATFSPAPRTVRPETRAAYMAHFKKPIFEGYGVTETAPVLALNTMGAFAGRLGRPPAARASRPAGTGSRHRRWRPAVGARPQRDAGLSAGRGARACCSRRRTAGTTPAISLRSTRDGFIAIKGRAKRFAKIGGEMVSLAAAEALATAVWPDAVQAVDAVPDARKGEKLLLVTTQRDAEPRALLASRAGTGHGGDPGAAGRDGGRQTAAAGDRQDRLSGGAALAEAESERLQAATVA